MRNILLFNDLSCVGNCSLGVNLPILSTLQVNCIPVVTATYSSQTAFDGYSYTPNGNVTEYARKATQLVVPNMVYVGFCPNKQVLMQVDEVAKSACCPVLVDPAMGDDGKLYACFDIEYVEAMKQVVSGADVITPNLTEACMLCGVDYNKLVASDKQGFLGVVGNTFKDICKLLNVGSAVITGVNCGDVMGNVVVEDGCVRYVSHDKHKVNYNGCGDMFASVVAGKLMQGCSLYEATQIASAFVAKACSVTLSDDRRFGTDFASALDILN